MGLKIAPGLNLSYECHGQFAIRKFLARSLQTRVTSFQVSWTIQSQIGSCPNGPQTLVFTARSCASLNTLASHGVEKTKPRKLYVKFKLNQSR
jgi:hypothetical protein